MAKTFDPSQLSPADQAAFSQWQQGLRSYMAANGGAISAPVSYALAHPDYLQQHPELRQEYDIVSGANLPASVREQVKDYHPVWSGDNAGNMQKNSKLWSKWETWLQLGLGAGVAAPVVLPALGVGGAAGGTGAGAGAAGAGASTVPALEGGTTLAANLGGAGALGAGGAASGTGAAAASPNIWDKIFGKTTADKVMTGLGMAGGLAGSLIQSNQADKATKAQQEAAAKALELQSNIYQQQRADLAPYRQAGASSLSALTYGLGLDPSKSADTTTPYFQQQFSAQNNAVPQNAQRNPNSPTTQPIPAGNYTGGQAVPRVSSLAGTAPDGTVAMMSPDGRQARVPSNQVQAALAAGGRLA